MNTKNTWVWLVVATGLFAFIYCFNHLLRPPVAGIGRVLPGLKTSTVDSIEVTPAGSLAVHAIRTNGNWLLEGSVTYPAQFTAIEGLLGALQSLTPATRISANEQHAHHSGSAEFGFDTPQDQIIIESGGQRWQLLVGNRTAPGDQVFLRVVGVDAVFVTSVTWLKLLPASPDDWRSTALVAAEVSDCDSIVLTNGSRSATGQSVVIELRRDQTNRLWRMVRPLPARADDERIADALQQLQLAQVSRFVTDDPKADWSLYGLQPSASDLWFGKGTNVISALHLGNSLTNNPNQVYARREGWPTIFATASQPLAAWSGAVNDFRDPHVVEIDSPIAEIQVQGPHDFTLEQGTNQWTVVGEKFAADPDSVGDFIKALAALKVASFVQAVVTAPDLAAYGLAAPQRRITLYSAVGNTNAIVAQLAFAQQTNGIFVHRADEDFIYSISTNDFNRLPEWGWEFRDRHLWNFSETNVAQILLTQNGKTRVLVRHGVNEWSLAPGSQGIINPPALEEDDPPHGGTRGARMGWRQRHPPGKLRVQAGQPECDVCFEKRREAHCGFWHGIALREHGARLRYAGRSALGVCLSAGDLPVRLHVSHHSGKRPVISNRGNEG